MELKGSTPRRRTTARVLLLSPHWERYHLMTRPRVPLWALFESQARARAATLSHGPRSEVFFADSQLRARHVNRLGDRPRREPPRLIVRPTARGGLVLPCSRRFFIRLRRQGRRVLSQQLLMQPNNCSS